MSQLEPSDHTPTFQHDVKMGNITYHIQIRLPAELVGNLFNDAFLEMLHEKTDGRENIESQRKLAATQINQLLFPEEEALLQGGNPFSITNEHGTEVTTGDADYTTLQTEGARALRAAAQKEAAYLLFSVSKPSFYPPKSELAKSLTPEMQDQLVGYFRSSLPSITRRLEEPLENEAASEDYTLKVEGAKQDRITLTLLEQRIAKAATQGYSASAALTRKNAETSFGRN